MPPTPAPNGKEQTPQPPFSPRPPTGAAIRVIHITSTNWMDSNAENSHLPPFTPALSYLRMLSPCRTGRPDSHGFPTILTVRTVLPNNIPFYQDTHSLIDRWEIKPTTPQIHSAFQQLSARRDSVGSKKTTSPAVSNILAVSWQRTNSAGNIHPAKVGWYVEQESHYLDGNHSAGSDISARPQ